MKYSKKPLPVKEQIIKLKEKNLLFKNETAAEHFLSVNNYYKFSGYAYPFQNHNTSGKPFRKNVYFESILNIYNFDMELRHLVFRSIEQIESALKAQILLQYSISHGSHWQLNSNLFKKYCFHIDSLNRLCYDVSRSRKENFISHY
jgi:Abortive infection bacteriophage resistance protein